VLLMRGPEVSVVAGGVVAFLGAAAVTVPDKPGSGEHSVARWGSSSG